MRAWGFIVFTKMPEKLLFVLPYIVKYVESLTDEKLGCILCSVLQRLLKGGFAQ